MKHILRQTKLLERLQQHAEEKERKDTKLLTRLKKLAVFQQANTILLYWPIHGEVDVSRLLTHASHDEDPQKKKRYVLPKVQDNHTIGLFWVTSMADTSPGTFGIMEPMSHLQAIEPEEIDLAIIPGIVFDRSGHRIGYGKGFYDRLLKKISGPKVGVAYDFQIVENIPRETHDIPMDMIITESKTITL